MKKNEIFTFTAPNEVEVTAVVVYTVFQGCAKQLNICYAQNRLFTFIEWEIAKDKGFERELTYGEVIVDYCVLPDYDELLQLHSSMEYSQWEQNLEAEIQGMNDR